ncbi:MAG: pitrilysin family protein [Trueperaceae bacterium]|nr:pitrilysin family protein [Trueperaceae bacterium]
MSERIYQTQLSNGLTLVLEAMPWLPSASLKLTLPVGAATDPEGQEGSATVLHDWLSRGAGGRDSRQLSDAFDSLGVRQGGSAGRESMSFSASLLADTLPDALRLYADIVRRPELADDEFVSARTTAEQELASLDDSPTQRLFLALSRTLFTSGQGRSPYGTEAGLAALSAESVRADFGRRVSPQGAILSVAGGVTWDDLRATVEESFGDWAGDGVPIPEPSIVTGTREHIDSDTSQTQIGVAYEAVAPGDEGWYENALVNGVLSGGMGSRLFKEVREKRGLVYSVAAVGRTVRGLGYTLGYAGTTPERADETLSVLLHELERIYDEGVEADELERARTGILSSLVMQGESSGSRADTLGRDIFLFGRPRPVEQTKEAIAAITVDTLNTFLANRPRPEFTVLTLGPKAVTRHAVEAL